MAGLEPDTKYKFLIQSRNAIGYSSESSTLKVSTLVTPIVPVQPEDQTLLYVGIIVVAVSILVISIIVLLLCLRYKRSSKVQVQMSDLNETKKGEMEQDSAVQNLIDNDDSKKTQDLESSRYAPRAHIRVMTALPEEDLAEV